MKKIFLFILVLFAFQNLTGQIIITRDDMPNIGDTIRLSTSLTLPVIDPALSGPDYTWDFSSLQPLSQTVEGYVSTQSTLPIFQIIFNSSVANIASPINGLNFLPGFEVTDAYIFYKESSSNYVRAGYAAAIMGVPVPMKFDQPELLYSFPLTADSPSDSSFSTYSLGFPGLGFFSIERKRVNTVDGWGSLTTPYGTFNTLRVKSIVTERDSIYIDSVQSGAPISRYYTEYKWLANGFGIPLLTITQEGALITSTYIDSVRNLTPMTVDLGSDFSICMGDSVTISATAANGVPPYSYLWNTLDTTASIRVAPLDTTDYTVVVTDQVNNIAVGSVTVNVIEFHAPVFGADTLHICAGSSVILDAGTGYQTVTWSVNGIGQAQSQTFTIDSTGIGLNYALIVVEYQNYGCSGSDTIVVKFVICGGIADLQPVALKVTPNPVKDFLLIERDQFTGNLELFITNQAGQIIRPSVTDAGSGRLLVSTQDLKPGNYIVVLIAGNKRGVAKFVRQ